MFACDGANGVFAIGSVGMVKHLGERKLISSAGARFAALEHAPLFVVEVNHLFGDFVGT